MLFKLLRLRRLLEKRTRKNKRKARLSRRERRDARDIRDELIDRFIPQLPRAREALVEFAETLAYTLYSLKDIQIHLDDIEHETKGLTKNLEELKKSMERADLMPKKEA